MTARHACSTLANLAENKETHSQLLEKIVAETLVDLIKTSKDIGLIMESTRCLTNLASEYETHLSLLRAGVPKAFEAAASYDDIATNRFAVLGIANLATQSQNHSSLLDARVNEPLVYLAGGGKRAWHKLAEDGSVMEGGAPEDGILGMDGYDIASK